MAEPTTSIGAFAWLFSSGDHSPRFAIIIAGFIGGVVSLRFVDHMTLRQRISSVATSVVLANYFAYDISDALGAAKYAEGCGAMIGLFGISLIGAILKAIKETDIAGIIKKRLGGE